jgi:hypothetical protein
VINNYAPVEVDDVFRMHAALGRLLDTMRGRMPGAWTPTWRSDAEDEVKKTSRLLRTDGSPWNESPLSTAFPVAGMLIDTVIQNADAIHVLLESRATSTLALDAQVRAALEAAAQAWWLLEPGIGGRSRVARLYVLRRSSASRLEQTAQKMDLASAAGYGAEVQQLDALYQDQLGLAPTLSSKGNWVGCEKQMAFDYTTRVKAFMEQIGQDPAAGPYAYYCGASHAELWRIQYSYDEVQTPGGQTIFVPRAPLVTVNAAVSVCVDAVTYPVARAFALLGRGASSTALHHLVRPIRTALTLI